MNNINYTYSPIKSFFYAAIFIVTLIFVALLSVRVISKALEEASHSSTPWLKERIVQILQYFEQPNQKNEKRLLFLGTSDVQLGINPIKLDSLLKQKGFDTESYNLGISNFDGKLLRLLAQRLATTIPLQNPKFNTILVKFTPLRTTKTYAHSIANHKSRYFEDFEAALYNDNMLKEEFFSSPNRTLELWYVKHILLGRSPVPLVQYLREQLWYYFPKNTGQSEILVKASMLSSLAWGKGEFNQSPAWKEEKRGHHYFGYPETKTRLEPLLDLYKDPEIAKQILKLSVYYSDALELDFNDDLVTEYIYCLHELKKISNNVLLLYFPDSSSINRPLEAELRLLKTLEKIKKEANVQFINYLNEKIFLPEDYFDQFHLNLQGQTKLAERLAQDLPRLLNLPKTKGPRE